MSSTDVNGPPFHPNVDNSPGEKARVMEVAADPISPQVSDADTVGNLTYIDGDVLDILLVRWKYAMGSISVTNNT